MAFIPTEGKAHGNKGYFKYGDLSVRCTYASAGH